MVDTWYQKAVEAHQDVVTHSENGDACANKGDVKNFKTKSKLAHRHARLASEAAENTVLFFIWTYAKPLNWGSSKTILKIEEMLEPGFRSKSQEKKCDQLLNLLKEFDKRGDQDSENHDILSKLEKATKAVKLDLQSQKTI